jgi:Ca2+-binding EF-hand superfamily protein
VFSDDGVTFEELTEMFKKFGLQLSEEDMKGIFNLLDVDGDGTVSKSELINWKLSHTATADKGSDFKAIAKEIFNLFDEDGSGEVTVEEFVDTLKKFDAGLTETEMLEVARDLDESGDGMLSLQEFEQAIENAVKQSS